jgi:exopolysaccharide biosynthesis polyprenyl glycosylphosphotransferase
VELGTWRERTRSANRDFVLRRLLAFSDVAGIFSALVISTVFVDSGDVLPVLFWGAVTIPAWIVLFKLYGLYDRDGKRVSHSTVDELPRLFHAVVIGSLGLYVVLRYSSAYQMPLLDGLAFFGLAFVGIAVIRAGARALSRRIISGERVLFVGGGPMAALLARKLRQHPEYHLEPIGYIDGHRGSDSVHGLTYLGELDEIDLISTLHAVDRVLILSPMVGPDEVADLIRRLRDLDLRVGVLPHVLDVLGPSVEIDDVEGITVLGLSPPKLTRSSRFLKRAMDVTLASLLLAVLLVPMILIALAIKLTSKGPVFYRGRRIGRGGREFAMLKFRTMVKDAEEQERELRERSVHPAWLLVDHDPRVTKVGRFLRHTSIDELPQLWNVIHGDMSLVGPRPMTASVDEHISGWGRRRLDLTPGMTGLWQVLGRTNIPFEEMVKLDYLYVTNWSLWEDVRLLIRTVPAVIRQRGAN